MYTRIVSKSNIKDLTSQDRLNIVDDNAKGKHWCEFSNHIPNYFIFHKQNRVLVFEED